MNHQFFQLQQELTYCFGIFQGNLSDALTSYDKLIEEDEDDFRPYLCQVLFHNTKQLTMKSCDCSMCVFPSRLQGLVHSLMGDQERAAVSFSEFKKRCPKDYAENVGIDQMVVRAKLSSKRLQVNYGSCN